jgi:hypothetical protein
MASFNSEDVINVACAIFRSKENTVVKDNTKGIPTSKLAMLEHFSGKNVIEITDEDRDFASICVKHLQHRLLMNQLRGQNQSKFVDDIIHLTQKGTIADRYFGVAVWIPRVVLGMVAEDQQKLDIAHIAFRSQYQGSLGDKVTIDFHPIRVKFVHEYDCYRHFGHDGNGNLIGFLNKNQLTGKLTGKVKAHEVSKYNGGGKVTYLNYVKVVK